jgi:hypothetical protein
MKLPYNVMEPVISKRKSDELIKEAWNHGWETCQKQMIQMLEQQIGSLTDIEGVGPVLDARIRAHLLAAAQKQVKNIK